MTLGRIEAHALLGKEPTTRSKGEIYVKQSSKHSSFAMVVLTLVAAAAMSLHSQAQTQNQSPSPSRSRSDEMLDRWNDIGNKLIAMAQDFIPDRKSTRLNSSHRCISYAVFCLKKKKKKKKKQKIKTKKK